MSGNSNFLSTFSAIRWANWLEQRRREKEKEELLNTIALVEEELAKPEYFGYLVERDRVGYLEALSKTKTTFRGLNPHDPLNGMVVNGELNPDFMLMLEKNFFKVNSENLSIDELNFVRYEAERDYFISNFQQTMQELHLDNEWVEKNIGISQEEMFEKLKKNELVVFSKASDNKLYVASCKRYLEGVENGEFNPCAPSQFFATQDQLDVLYGFEKISDKRVQLKEKMGKSDDQVSGGTITAIVFLIFCIAIITYIVVHEKIQ